MYYALLQITIDLIQRRDNIADSNTPGTQLTMLWSVFNLRSRLIWVTRLLYSYSVLVWITLVTGKMFSSQDTLAQLRKTESSVIRTLFQREVRNIVRNIYWLFEQLNHSAFVIALFDPIFYVAVIWEYAPPDTESIRRVCADKTSYANGEYLTGFCIGKWVT